MICFHKWSKWSNPISTYGSGNKQQWRVCDHCNKAQFRTLRWDKQSDIQQINSAIESVAKTKPSPGDTVE